jgi:hypothetical protein
MCGLIRISSKYFLAWLKVGKMALKKDGVDAETADDVGGVKLEPERSGDVGGGELGE